MSSRFHRNAFTLIELLVVVAIIALLISILLPSLSRARAQARTVKCLSSQRQMSVGNQLYADAYDGFYVPIYQWGGPNSGQWIWNNEAYPQMMGLSVEPHEWYAERFGGGFLCPEIPNSTWEVYGMGHNYAFNSTTIVLHSELNAKVAKVTSVDRPASKCQMVGSGKRRTNEAGSDPAAWEAHGDGPSLGYNVAYRHNEGEAANIQFFDGHAATLSKDEAYPPTDDESDALWDIYESEPRSWAGPR